LRPEPVRVPAGQEFSPDPEYLEDRANSDAADRFERRELRPGEVVERDVTGELGGGGLGTQIVVNGVVVDNVRATWTLPVEYLRAELRAREGDVDMIAVDGDSMIPTLVPGDRCMIHRRQTAPSPDGLYAIHNGVGVVVKRLEVVLGSDPLEIVVKSDNPAHSAYRVLAEQIRVIGRVICKVTRV
jgi:phage repressor protein C with HTH and peptisase S24 domain